MTDTRVQLIVNEAAKVGVATSKRPMQWLFAHGAGAPMDSDFMNRLAEGVAAGGITVKRFEFPYMEQRRETGKKRPPDRAPKLLDHFAEVIQQELIEQDGALYRCVIGGKSMGGRMASILASQAPESVLGVVCLGYPFYPAGKLEKTRIDHFNEHTIPHCVVQGTRDALGNYEQVGTYDLPAAVKIHWLEDGDHDLKPRKKSGLTHDAHIATAIETVIAFIESCVSDNYGK